MNNPRNENNLTWIVAGIGIIILIILSYATMVMWDLAHPVPKNPDSAINLTPPDFSAREIQPDQSPWIRIDPIGDAYRGDAITISGTTSDPGGNMIRVVIAAPGTARQRTWAGNTVAVIPEPGGRNRWSFVFDSTSFNTSGNVVTACIENTSADMCASQQFNLNEPLQLAVTPAGCWQRIDPVTDHGAGEVFTINGTTNCRPGDRITVEIVSVSSGKSSRDYSNGDVEVRQLSTSTYGWSVTIDSSAFGPGQKTVTACGVGICGFQTFSITDRS
ncbi:MAG: hypothetical protein WC391_05860 [Methanoregula sp.]|jgi:hypothetical protein